MGIGLRYAASMRFVPWLVLLSAGCVCGRTPWLSLVAHSKQARPGTSIAIAIQSSELTGEVRLSSEHGIFTPTSVQLVDGVAEAHWICEPTATEACVGTFTLEAAGAQQMASTTVTLVEVDAGLTDAGHADAGEADAGTVVPQSFGCEGSPLDFALFQRNGGRAQIELLLDSPVAINESISLNGTIGGVTLLGVTGYWPLHTTPVDPRTVAVGIGGERFQMFSVCFHLTSQSGLKLGGCAGDDGGVSSAGAPLDVGPIDVSSLVDGGCLQVHLPLMREP